MRFDLNQKIEFLNRLAGNTLTLTHYTDWELGSYRGDSLFRQWGLIGHVRANDFAECVDKAFGLVREKIANG